MQNWFDLEWEICLDIHLKISCISHWQEIKTEYILMIEIEYLITWNIRNWRPGKTRLKNEVKSSTCLWFGAAEKKRPWAPLSLRLSLLTGNFEDWWSHLLSWFCLALAEITGLKGLCLNFIFFKSSWRLYFSYRSKLVSFFSSQSKGFS